MKDGLREEEEEVGEDLDVFIVRIKIKTPPLSDAGGICGGSESSSGRNRWTQSTSCPFRGLPLPGSTQQSRPCFVPSTSIPPQFAIKVHRARAGRVRSFTFVHPCSNMMISRFSDFLDPLSTSSVTSVIPRFGVDNPNHLTITRYNIGSPVLASQMYPALRLCRASNIGLRSLRLVRQAKQE